MGLLPTGTTLNFKPYFISPSSLLAIIRPKNLSILHFSFLQYFNYPHSAIISAIDSR